MGKKNKPPKPPNFQPLADASLEQAKMANELAKEQYAWAREKYEADSVISKQVVEAALERQKLNDQNAVEDRARYQQIFQPLEDNLAQEALDYASPQRSELNAMRAQAGVAQQFDAARQRSLQNLQSFGIDPSSLRYAALDRGANVQQAAAAAAAGNQSREQTEAIGRALRSEAINVGRGYPGQIAGTYGTALQSGNQGINSALATTASGANTMGTGTQWGGLGNQAIGTAGDMMNMGYGNQLNAWNAQQNMSSGLGSLLGTGMGMAASMYMAEGGQVTSGGNVPPQASPTGGKAIDDVPARLTAGEFVVPKDVVSWKGEEFFQKLIEGSRKAKPEAPAKPEYALAPPQEPTFQSRPQSALPMG
jgi:hypothetical protein